MKVWDYLEKRDLQGRVNKCLAGLGIPEATQFQAVWGLKTYDFVINHRAKSRYGCVKHNKMTMELTSEYFVRGYTLHEDRIEDHDQTLLHETAHIIVNKIWPGVKAHGKEWKKVMHLLGARAERCGSSEFLHEAARKKDLGHKHEYTCQNCGYVYKTKRKLVRIENRRHGACGSAGRLTHRQVR